MISMNYGSSTSSWKPWRWMRLDLIFSMWYIYINPNQFHLFQYTFYQFQYLITTCLCMVEIYQEMFRSNSFNRNDLMVLFSWDWSRLINKLSLIGSLNLLASKARISKWSKSIEHLHSSRWSDTADFLTLLRRFLVLSSLN